MGPARTSLSPVIDSPPTFVFFYGSQIDSGALTHIIGHDAKFFSACLDDFTCHPVKNRGYCAIIPLPYSEIVLSRRLTNEEKRVQGKVITQLNVKQLHLLDEHFCNDFKRIRTSVCPLSSTLHERQMEVQTYVWVGFLDRLVPSLISSFGTKLTAGAGNHHSTCEETTLNGASSTPKSVQTNDHLPQFGHDLLSKFCFDNKYVNLNHGSYGSLPRPVADAAVAMTYEIERRPDHFLRRGFYGPLNSARERLARLVNADVNDLVLVPNATHGINTVLRNLIWSSHDVIVTTSCTYSSVACGVQYLHDVPPHPSISKLDIAFDTTQRDIVEKFRSHLKSIPRRENQKILAVIDSIAGFPGCLLPWKKMVRVCKEESVISLVDASHSIGQEMGIDLRSTDPDFWISNCHKWLYVKRGCAILYVPQRNQHLILSPLPTSEYYVSPEDPAYPNAPKVPNFIQQFAWNGTKDFVPYLSVHSALEFREYLGGEKRINDYCHSLALKGRRRLLEILKTSALSEEFTVNMCNIEIPIPIPKEFPIYKLATIKKKIQDKLLDEWDCFVPPYILDGRLWVRCSAQVFNELSDFDYVGNALLHICAEIAEEYGFVSGSESSKSTSTLG